MFRSAASLTHKLFASYLTNSLIAFKIREKIKIKNIAIYGAKNQYMIVLQLPCGIIKAEYDLNTRGAC